MALPYPDSLPNGQAYPIGTPSAYAIALLFDLAQRGEIDPWDVQVIEVIDRCLNELMALTEANPGMGIADLSQSGQAFVDASLLVLLKANTLEQLESADQNTDAVAEAEWLETGENWEASGLPRNLEQQLRRRPSAQPPTYRRVTLQELIEQLQLVAAAIEEKPRRTRGIDRRSQSRNQVMRVALELVREENSVEIASELAQFLTNYYSELAATEHWLDLEHLLVLWSQKRKQETEKTDKEKVSWATEDQVRPDSTENTLLPSMQEQLHDRVGIFWALLMLSAQSKVELLQEEFYQDLKIRAI